jgi:hypothetical protein
VPAAGPLPCSFQCAEQPEVPSGPDWINDHYQSILLEQQQELQRQQHAEVAAAEAMSPRLGALKAVVPAGQATGDGEQTAVMPAKDDFSPTNIRQGQADALRSLHAASLRQGCNLRSQAAGVFVSGTSPAGVAVYVLFCPTLLTLILPTGL